MIDRTVARNTGRSSTTEGKTRASCSRNQIP
jgi:hypothetical protein